VLVDNLLLVEAALGLQHPAVATGQGVDPGLQSDGRSWLLLPLSFSPLPSCKECDAMQ
jgi:hypothetical protein